MSSPLFNFLGGGAPNLMQLLGQLRNNPTELLQRAGFNIPANASGPQQIIQHLMQTGQINQTQLNQAQQMSQLFGIK